LLRLKIKALFELLKLYKRLNDLLTLYETFLYFLKLIKQMKPKIAIFMLFTLILVPSLVSAANIHGTIYDFELEKTADTLVEINTSPKQSFVSKDGERPLRQGQAVLVLRGEEHSNYNIADETTEYITVTATF